MTCPACNAPADPLSNCPRCGEFVPVTVTPKQATIPASSGMMKEMIKKLLLFAAEIDSLRAQLQVAKSQTESDRKLIVELHAENNRLTAQLAGYMRADIVLNEILNTGDGVYRP